MGNKLGIHHIQDFLKDFDLILISETWLQERDSDDVTFGNYEVHYVIRKSLHKNARRGSGGMTILHRNTVDVKIVQTVCDHFAVLQLQNKTLEDDKLYIISCYIPPAGTTFLCRDCNGDYFSVLNELVETYNHIGQVVITGDLNARVSNRLDYTPGGACVTECFEVNCKCQKRIPSPRNSLDLVCNEYGNELLNVCKATGMYIVNGRLHSDKTGEFTRDGTTGRSVVDYVLVDHKSEQVLTDFRINSQLPDSDHKPVCFILDRSFKVAPNKENQLNNNDRRKYYVWDKSKQDVLHECMFDVVGMRCFEKFWNSISMNEDVDLVANHLENFLIQAANRTLKLKTAKTKTCSFPQNKWFNNDCKELGKKLRKLDLKDERQREVYHETNRQYKKVIQRNQREAQHQALEAKGVRTPKLCGQH